MKNERAKYARYFDYQNVRITAMQQFINSLSTEQKEEAKNYYLQNQKKIEMVINKNKIKLVYINKDFILSNVYILFVYYYFKYTEDIIKDTPDDPRLVYIMHNIKIYIKYTCANDYIAEDNMHNDVTNQMNKNITLYDKYTLEGITECTQFKNDDYFKGELASIINKFDKTRRNMFILLAQGQNFNTIDKMLNLTPQTTSYAMYRIRRNLEYGNVNYAYYFRLRELYCYLKDLDYNPQVNLKEVETAMNDIEFKKELIKLKPTRFLKFPVRKLRQLMKNYDYDFITGKYVWEQIIAAEGELK